MQYEEEIMQIVNVYVIPWGINILVALLIFLIGRIVVGIISSLIGKALSHTKWDTILVEFVQQLVRAILLIFVIVAVLDQLGVNTTSVIAVLGAAGLAIGLALQGSLQNFAAGLCCWYFARLNPVTSWRLLALWGWWKKFIFSLLSCAALITKK